MKRIRAGLYSAQINDHMVEVMYTPPQRVKTHGYRSGGEWAFYIDGEPSSSAWPTKAEAVDVATRTAITTTPLRRTLSCRIGHHFLCERMFSSNRRCECVCHRGEG